MDTPTSFSRESKCYGIERLPWSAMMAKSKIKATPKTRRSFLLEFKKDAVQMMLDGHSASSITKNLGIDNTNLLYHWKADFFVDSVLQISPHSSVNSFQSSCCLRHEEYKPEKTAYSRQNGTNQNGDLARVYQCVIHECKVSDKD